MLRLPPTTLLLSSDDLHEVEQRRRYKHTSRKKDNVCSGGEDQRERRIPYMNSNDEKGWSIFSAQETDVIMRVPPVAKLNESDDTQLEVKVNVPGPTAMPHHFASLSISVGKIATVGLFHDIDVDSIKTINPPEPSGARAKQGMDHDMVRYRLDWEDYHLHSPRLQEL